MQIRYCYAMLERIEDRAALPLQDMPLDKIPSHIREIMENHKAFRKSNTFGRKGLGTPEEYEKLIISEDDRIRTFEYFNKAMHYMATGTEKDRPVFQVFAHFMVQAKRSV